MAMLDQTAAPRVPLPVSAANSAANGVVTFDDVLDEAERKRVYEFLRGTGWSFGWKSNGANDQFSFWHRHFAGTRGQAQEQDVRNPPDCAEELRRAVPLLFALWAGLAKTVFAEHKLVRCYANGQSYGSDGTVHTDSISDRSYTSVYYPHDVWNPNWGGETVFFNREKTDLIASVYPKPNRLVIFRGNVPHAARGVSRTCPALRITLMFKTELNDD